jgi:hypothetical protein
MKLIITIEVDATDADPSTALEAAQAFAEDFAQEHGGEVDEERGVSVECKPGKPAREDEDEDEDEERASYAADRERFCAD